MTRDWRDDASCLDQDTEAWFPKDSDRATTARKICRSCPVRNECLEFALANRIPEGVWGGLLPAQRKRKLKKAS